MARKFNKKIKYQKKNFNIYKKIDPPNKIQKIQDPKLNEKLKFKDLDPKLKSKLAEKSRRPSFYDRLFDLFRF